MRLAVVLWLLVVWCVAQPSDGLAQSQAGADEKPSLDVDIRLPSYPVSKNLIQFFPGIGSNSRFFIDPVSISTVGDGIARYTLVVISPGGATNVSYEGISCKSVEHSYYAFGRSDGTWSRARSSEWRAIGNDSASLQRALYWNYFCPGRLYGGTAADAIKRFKSGVSAREPVRD
jgi:CNP1-like family